MLDARVNCFHSFEHLLLSFLIFVVNEVARMNEELS